MIISLPFHDNNPRLPVLAGVVGVGLLVLLFALFRVQVLKAEHFGNREQAQSLRRIRIPSARGEIVDRSGVVLANNRPSYDVVIYLDQLGQTSKRQDVLKLASDRLRALSTTLGLPVPLTDRDVRLHYQRRRPLPLPVWRDLPPQTVAAFAERCSTLPGAELIVTPVRQYPHGTLGAHLLGYVGKAEQSSDEDALDDFYYYQPDSVGKQGVERAYDEYLRGAPGGRTIRVNPGGRTVGEVGSKDAERGGRLILTMDARIQKITEDALAHAPLPAGRELRGAAVVLDPRSGAVLASASVPAFDPNLFNPGAPAGAVAAVLTNQAGPLLNRASGARYAPGSTFKPITLLAGLVTGKAAIGETAVCTGEMKIGNWPRPFKCWNPRGHGTVDGMMAIRQSCDVWFYKHGITMGAEAIAQMAGEFGLGQATGLDLSPDQPGLVPTPGWKRLKYNEGWRDGDTAQMAIGQSFLLVTPLQMANVAATLANRGTVWQPFVVQRAESATGEVLSENRPTARHQVQAPAQALEQIRLAMLGAINSSDGTGNAAALRGVTVAGKTGTAEHDLFENGERRRIKRTWFIGFAPYEDPQVAVAVVLEDGESGGHTAAPVAGHILSGIFNTAMVRASGAGD